MKFLHTIKPVLLSSDPTGSASGEFYYNSTTGKWRGYNGSSWIDVNSSSATISSSAVISTSAVFSSSAITATIAVISASVDWSGVSNKPTSIASATISSSAIISSSANVSTSANIAYQVDWSNVTNKPTSIASSTYAASVDWSGVTSKPTSIASATISSSALVAAQVDWNNVTNQPTTIASSTYSSSALFANVSTSATISSSSIYSASVDWGGVSNKPSTIASATVSNTSITSSSAIIAASALVAFNAPTAASVNYSNVSGSSTISTSAVISSSAITASVVDWAGVANKPSTIASATISASTTSIDWTNVQNKPSTIASATVSASSNITASVDWSGVNNKPSSIASATISTSAVMSSNAVVSSSANISSSAITSTSATLSSSAIISSSADWNGISNKPTSIASATISSSAILSSSALISNSSTSATISSSAIISGSSTTSSSAIIAASATVAASSTWSSSSNYSLQSGSSTYSSSAQISSSAVISASSTIAASSTWSSSSNYAVTAQNVITGSSTTVILDHIDLSTTPAVSPSVGRIMWDTNDGTIQVGMIGGNVNLQVGQEQLIRAVNQDTVTLVDGDVVYISGVQGQRIGVARASASVNGLEKSPIGIVTEPIAINQEGFVTISGLVHDIDTRGFTAGDDVWLSASAGKYTNVRPPAPLHASLVGHVVKIGPNGSIHVRVVEGQKLKFLNDVVLTASTLSGDSVLAYNVSTDYWENTSIQNKISTASVGYANTSASSTVSTSATISSSAIISSSADWNGISNKPTTIASATISSSAITSSSATIAINALSANNSASLGAFQASDYGRLAAANTWSAVNTFQAGIYVGNGSNSQSLTTQTPVQSIPDGTDAAVVFRRNNATTTNPVSALHKYDAALTASVSQRMLNFYLSGSIAGFITTNTIAAPTFGGTSDYRLKENIQDFNDSYDLIKQIKVRSFNWKGSGINSIGFIAHELKEVLPVAVDGEKDAVDNEGNPAYQSVMESRLIPYLTGALKDTILKVEKLEENIVQLQNKINELERQ